MLPFFLMLAAVLLLPILGLAPPVFVRKDDRKGATNSPFWVTFPRLSSYGGDLVEWESGLTEELVEFYVRWIGAAVLAGAVLALAPMPAVAACFLLVACTLWTRPLYRFVEYFGKSAYSQARGLPVDSEAGFLLTYAEFKGADLGRVQRNLRRAAPLSRLLTVLLSGRIARAGRAQLA